MPSTYTVNLGIEKPATGEQSGTWGDTTNVNFDILDQAINGAERVTLTSAGSSGSPNSLQITNGATSDGRNKWLEFYSSSDLGGSAYVQLDPNDAEKIVFVRNSLAGSQSVILFQGTYNAARDLEVPAGVDMVVKFDGGGASAATVTDVYTKLRVTELTTPTLTATTADINGGTLDNSVIGGTTAAAITGTTIVANTSLNIAGDGATVTGIKDEDDMSSNSPTKLATQQSIKAYVDSQVGTVDTWAEVLANGATSGSTNPEVTAGQALKTDTINETTAGSGVTIDSVLLKDDVVNATDIEVSSISANDGTEAATLANSTGVMTIASSVLTTTDINAGTIDNTTIGGSTAAVGSFTSLNASSTIKGESSTGGFITLKRDDTTLTNNADVGAINFETTDTDDAGVASTILASGDGTGGGVKLRFYAGKASNKTERLTLYNSGVAVFNEDGNDFDFRVESSSNNSALFVDAGNSRVGVNTSAPASPLHVAGVAGTGIRMTTTASDNGGNNFMDFYNADGRMGYLGYASGSADIFYIWNEQNSNILFGANGAERLRITPTTVVVNEGSDDVDFRVESNGNENMLLVDAGNDHVNIGTSSDFGGVLNVNGGGVFDDATILDPDTMGAGRIGFGTIADGGGFSAPGMGWGATGGNTAAVVSTGGNIYVGTGDRTNANSLKTRILVNSGEVVFNDDSTDTNFRVESDNQSHMLFVDAGTDHIGIKNDSPGYDLTVGTDGSLGAVSDNFKIPLAIDGGYSTTNSRQHKMLGFIGTSNGPEDVYASDYTTSGEYVKNFFVGLYADNSYFNNSSLRIVQGAETRLRIDQDGAFIINSSGIDRDTVIRGSTKDNLFYVDAGDDRVSIDGEVIHDSESGSQKFYITRDGATNQSGSMYVDDAQWVFDSLQDEVTLSYGGFLFRSSNATNTNVDLLTMSQSEIRFNETSYDIDFRVESDVNSHTLFVQASNGHVGIADTAPATPLAVNGSTTLGGGGASTAFTRLTGLGLDSGGTLYGSYGQLLFNATNSYTSSARRFLLTNGYGANKFAIIASTSSTDDPTLGSGGSLGSGQLRMVIDNVGSFDFNASAVASDFRVQSDSNSNMLFVNGGDDIVGIGTTGDADFSLFVERKTGNAIRAGLLRLGSSGGEYPMIGYPLKWTSSNGSYVYDEGDVGAAIRFGQNSGRLETFTIATGTAGSALSLSGGPYVVNGGTSWTTFSDSRLKTVTSEISGGIDKVKAMRPINFTWNNDDSSANQLGFLAQEMQSIVPEVVSGSENEIEPKTGDTVYMGIDYEKLVPVLTAALKEAVTKIETLEARVAALESS